MPVVGPPEEGATIGTPRMYRCRGVDNTSPGNPIPGDWSVVETPSPGPTTEYHWFLSDPLVQGSGVQFDLSTDWKPTIHEVDTIYYPIGRQFGIKSTSGTKGLSGQIEATTATYASWQAMVALLSKVGTLLLQGPAGQTYITLDGDRPADVNLATIGRTDYTQVKHEWTYIAAATP